MNMRLEKILVKALLRELCLVLPALTTLLTGFFSTSSQELSYGRVNLQPLLFQDDINRLSTNLQDVQAGNQKLESVIESKLQDFNLDKSCTIVIGSRVKKKEIKEQMLDNPIQLCQKTIKVLKLINIC